MNRRESLLRRLEGYASKLFHQFVQSAVNSRRGRRNRIIKQLANY